MQATQRHARRQAAVADTVARIRAIERERGVNRDTLAAIKAEPKLAAMELLRRSRLSVVPVTPEEFACILHMGACKLPVPRAR